MKILVTGATGFIGYDLAKALKQKGHEVITLVRETSDYVKLKKLNFKLVFGDITDKERMSEIFQNEKFDYVFHAAAEVSGVDHEEMYRINVEGACNIAEACLENTVKRLIYVSSVAAVSGNDDVPLKEDLPYKTTSFYGFTKAEAEKRMLEYRRRGLAVAIIRPCMVYGEGEPHGLDKAIGAIQKRIIPIPDLKDMKDKLHLVYVDNVIQALLLAMDKKDAVSGTFMVADKEVISMRKFLEIVSDELGAGRPFVVPGWLVRSALLLPPVKKRFTRIFKDRVYDITRAVEILGYDPKVSTEEGLRRTVRYWMKNKLKV